MEVDASGVDCRIPAECVLATREGQWPGADLRIYRFHARRTSVPPLRDVAVIAYHTCADIALRCGGISGATQMRPWDFSILRPGLESRWQWSTSFKTTVLYLTERKLAQVAAEVFDRDVDSVSVHESFQIQDRVIRHGVASLAMELSDDKLGGRLYSDAIVTQLCVHLLRNHGSARLRAPRCPGALNAAQSRRVAAYIEENLGGDLSLETLAGIGGMSQYHFARLFRKRFGVPPHAYVQRRRLERARKLILHSDMALKEIVGASGFCDQSHLGKSFKRAYAVTPAELRKRGA